MYPIHRVKILYPRIERGETGSFLCCHLSSVKDEEKDNSDDDTINTEMRPNTSASENPLFDPVDIKGPDQPMDSDQNDPDSEILIKSEPVEEVEARGNSTSTSGDAIILPEEAHDRGSEPSNIEVVRLTGAASPASIDPLEIVSTDDPEGGEDTAEPAAAEPAAAESAAAESAAVDSKSRSQSLPIVQIQTSPSMPSKLPVQASSSMSSKPRIRTSSSIPSKLLKQASSNERLKLQEATDLEVRTAATHSHSNLALLKLHIYVCRCIQPDGCLAKELSAVRYRVMPPKGTRLLQLLRVIRRLRLIAMRRSSRPS